MAFTFKVSEEIAASVIAQCKISSIPQTLQRWGRISDMETQWLLEKRPTKMMIAKKFCQLIKQNDFTDEILGDLELSYIQLHPRGKSWKVFKLWGEKLKLDLDPRSLRSRLVKRAQLSWRNGNVQGNMSLFAGAIWFRLHFSQPTITSRGKKVKASAFKNGYKRTQSVFLLLFKHSPYIMVSNSGQRLMRIVCEAAQHVMNAERLSGQLTGRHVASLADIVHNRNFQAKSCKFREKECKENSLCPQLKRKRSEEEADPPPGIHDEDLKEKRVRVAYLRDNFGDKQQPELETASFKFKSDFKGHKGLVCHSSVELRGPSVLEGLCQMVKTGAIRCPLPKHITGITTRAQNHLVLENRSRMPQF